MMSFANVKRAAPYAAILAAGVYLYEVALRIDYSRVPGRIGPDAWPRLILVPLIAICVAQVLRLAFSRKSGNGEGVADAAEEEGTGAGLHLSTRSHPRLAWAGIALTFVYLYAFEAIGFFSASVIYLLLLMFVGGYRRPLSALAISVATSLAFVFVFMKVVYVSLPHGKGPFLELSVAVMKLIGIH